MSRRSFLPWVGILAGLALVALVSAPAAGDDPQAVKPKDLTKKALESPLKNAIGGGPLAAPIAPRVDFTKGRIETALKGAVANPGLPPVGNPARAAPVPPPLDVRKYSVEAPTKDVVKSAGPAGLPRPGIDRGKADIEVPVKEVVTSAAPDKNGFVNPKVEPGRVRWHADFEAACAAAKKSGKPVFLFQMMGKLDDRFC